MAPYADELDRHGAWYYGDRGRPRVAPLRRGELAAVLNGRWTWSVFGWTWVPYESWGWAVSHYGRWGFTPALGWYWIPGATWAPAWVSWAAGGDYVGWCPLGYGDRPVLAYDRLGRGNHGHAVTRPGTSVAETPWIYLRRGDVGARDLTRRRVQLDGNSVQQVRVLESAQARPDPRPRGDGGAAGGSRARGPQGRVYSPADVRHRARDARRSHDADPGRAPPRPARSRPRGPAGRPESGSVAGAPSGAVTRFEGAADRDNPGATTLTPVPAALAAHPTDVRSGQRRAEEAPETGAIVGRSRSADAGSAHARSRGARARGRGPRSGRRVGRGARGAASDVPRPGPAAHGERARGRAAP